MAIRNVVMVLKQEGSLELYAQVSPYITLNDQKTIFVVIQVCLITHHEGFTITSKFIHKPLICGKY